MIGVGKRSLLVRSSTLVVLLYPQIQSAGLRTGSDDPGGDPLCYFLHCKYSPGLAALSLFYEEQRIFSFGDNIGCEHYTIQHYSSFLATGNHSSRAPTFSSVWGLVALTSWQLSLRLTLECDAFDGGSMISELAAFSVFTLWSNVIIFSNSLAHEI